MAWFILILLRYGLLFHEALLAIRRFVTRSVPEDSEGLRLRVLFPSASIPAERWDECEVDKVRQRSTSPKTMSKDPRMAETSASK